ncbi:hypothetical protein V492_08246, partial [Pseudogymnoascus sp. VKM F-4246]
MPQKWDDEEDNSTPP